MHISILGAGHAGTAVAADLSLRGHDVTLIKTSRSLHNRHFDRLQASGGAVRLIEAGRSRQAKIRQVTRELSPLRDSSIVMVFIQSNFHEQLIRRIRPFLRDGQILLFNPGYLSTAYVKKHAGDLDLRVVEAQSSFIDCRLDAPGTVRVSFRNVRNPLGVYPARHREACAARLRQLGFPFAYLESVVEAALHNPNLIVHTVGAIFSIPRIEATGGDYYMYREVFTPSVWRVLEALDAEKMDVMAALGCARVSYLQACKFRNTLDEERDAKEVFFAYAYLPQGLRGPLTVDSRFIAEDVPQGLVLLETLGAEYGVSTPVCTALIEVASAALGRDLRREGRSVERLGRARLQEILQEGDEGCQTK